jgi:hypothetical protein
MDEEPTTSRPDSSRRRLKIAGIATAALLAVPGGAVISNAFAAGDGGTTTPSTQPSQSQAPPAESPAPPQRGDGDGDGDGPRGHHGECPGMGGDGPQGGSSGSGTGTTGTAYSQQ